MGFHLERLASQIQRVLSIALTKEARDYKLEFITITRVELTSDLSYANCFYTTLYTKDKEKSLAKESLKDAKSFLRKKIADNVKMRKIPDLRFHYDDSFEQGNRIDEILEKIK